MLLLISSGLDIYDPLLVILGGIQYRTKLRVHWIPILDSPAELWAIKDTKKQYRSLVNKGGLLSVRNVKKLAAAGLIRFVKEKLFSTFQIGGEPVIVSLDHHGRIVHYNAMRMILMRVGDIVEGFETGVEIGDSIIPMLQNVLRDRTLAIRNLVGDIDGKLKEIAGKMERLMIEELHGIEKQIHDPVCMLCLC